MTFPHPLDPPLSAEPDPAFEGEDIEVEFGGDEQLYYSVDGGPWQELPLSPDGTGTITAPSGAESIVISDRNLPTTNNIEVEIYSTGSPRP